MFAVFGGVDENVFLRDGAFRAQGPFQHPILAGTVGAVCFPLMVGIWRQHRLAAILGSAACIGMIVACASSGPVMSLIFGVCALLLWCRPDWVKAVRWTAVAIYLGLELVMSRPAYYVMSKIDLTGSSTGWHRSRLIEMAIDHFGEWWLFGTDRTIHWMGITIGWSERHSDITNYYIWIGIIGGFPAMALLIAMMWRAFSWVGQAVRAMPDDLARHQFMIWCLGAGLFAHASTSFSVAYFDQSALFFWLNVAVISSMHAGVVVASPAAQPTPSAAPALGPTRRRAARWRQETHDPWPGPGLSSMARMPAQPWTAERT